MSSHRHSSHLHRPAILLPASLLRVSRRGTTRRGESVDVVVLTAGERTPAFAALVRIARAFRARGRRVVLRRVS